MSAAIRGRFLASATLVILVASGAIGAQLTSGLSGPVLGYAFDAEERQLRPLRGIPGSATVGAAVDAGFAFSDVLTLDASHVIVSTDANPELVVLDLKTIPLSTTTIPGLPANPSNSAASLDGKSAAFYYAGMRHVLIVTGLPQRPVGSYRFELPLLEFPLTHMVVSDDGKLLVYAVNEGRGESLYAWTASSGSPRYLTSAVSVSSIAISQSHAAIVADRGTDEVIAIWDAGGPAVRQFLVGREDGVSNPAAVAVSSDNRIHIANAGSSTVMILDPAGRLEKNLRCTCVPTGLHTLRDSVFLLTNRTDKTVFLFDGSPGKEQIFFVPPAQN